MNEIANLDDTFDKIHAYYTNNTALSPKDLEIAERWELGFALMLEHRNKKVVISHLIRLQTKKGLKLSIAQAYRDLANAERIFAPIKKYSSEFLRLVLLESAFKDVKQAERWANKATSHKDWASAMDIKNKAEYRIIQVGGLNDVDANLPDFSKIQPAEFNINIPKEVEQLLLKVASAGSVDVTELIKDSAQDVEFEEE